MSVTQIDRSTNKMFIALIFVLGRVGVRVQNKKKFTEKGRSKRGTDILY